MSDPHATLKTPVPDGQACRLEDKVAWMRRSLGPGDELIETHFAFVLLAGGRAWKLRRPVRRDPMDYATLEARRRGAESDVRLNRRLAPGVYLGVRPLTCIDGRFAIGGNEPVVDWLVEMQRLDRGRTLDVMLAKGHVSPRDLAAIAVLLAAFYASEPPAVADGAALVERLTGQVAANHRVLETIDAPRAEQLRSAQMTALASRRAWFDERATRGCVVEAHGDLRPEHVVLTDPPVVIDCLEFDRNLRVLDRAEELEYFVLDGERIGHGAACRDIARQCLERLGDAAPPGLLQFYRSHRAATRAKLYAWRAGEPDDGSPALWLETAARHLGIALDAANRSLG
jgi:aminoglycoside phosphotransferase family enzyme